MEALARFWLRIEYVDFGDTGARLLCKNILKVAGRWEKISWETMVMVPHFPYALYFFILRRSFAGSRQAVQIEKILGGLHCEPGRQSILVLR